METDEDKGKKTVAEKLANMQATLDLMREHVDADKFFDAILDIGEAALKVVADGRITWTETLRLGALILSKVNEARK